MRFAEEISQIAIVIRILNKKQLKKKIPVTHEGEFKLQKFPKQLRKLG